MRRIPFSYNRRFITVAAVVSGSLPVVHAQLGADAAPGKTPALIVEGSGFEIQDLLVREQAFPNRDYECTTVPSFVEGWKFTEIAGGTAPQINVLSLVSSPDLRRWPVEATLL